jgi:hypothetical protein
MSFLKLQMVKLGVDTVVVWQLLVGAFLCHYTVLDDKILSALRRMLRRWAMGDGDDGAAAHQPFHGTVNLSQPNWPM